MTTKIKTSEERIAEMELVVNNAFKQLMELVAPANRDQVIQLWVDGTHNSRYIGWEKGYDAGNGN